MIVITVARKPLSEASVAANVLKHGTGALNIDASRVGHQTDDKRGMRRTQNPQSNGQSMAGEGWWRGCVSGSDSGRWPANLVLQHKPGCRKAGTKQVKGITGGPTSGDNAFGQDAGWNRHENRATAISRPVGPDGTETVEAWDCEPGCPVADLDGQTGERPSTWTHSRDHRRSDAKPESKFRPVQGEYMPQGPLYADAGGASRFFKQVGGQQQPDEE